MADENRDREKAAEADRTRPPAVETEEKLKGRKPDAVKVGEAKRPRGVVSRIMADAASRERPAALPMPSRKDVSALAPPSVIEKWGAEAAGLKALSQDDNVITMFGTVGEDFWTGEGITAKKVSAQLRAIGDRDVEVHINSFGGDMFEGIAVYNVLREHAQKVTVKVMGMAASAASVIAMAGDSVEIGAASFLMIHKCWVVAMGNENDFRETADFLAPFDQAMAEVYAQRSGQTVEACTKWMAGETYMSGSTAIDRGFADQLLPADKITRDQNEQEKAREDNKARAAVLKFMATGDSRAEARSRVKELKGMPDAARDDAMPDAGDDANPSEDFLALTAGIRKST